jgi:hypothetical protein
MALETGALATSEPPAGTLRSPRRWFRWYLLLLLVVGFTSSELWPLSSFHLFSARKEREWRAHAVEAVLPDGTEEGISFHTFPIALRHTQKQISDFAGWTQAHRDEFCDGWIAVLRERGTDARFIRIYWASYDVKTMHRTSAELRYTCGSDRPAGEVAARAFRDGAP